MSQHHNRPLNKQDYKTLSLAALGGALEFYDFIIFVFFAVALGELFFPADIPEWLRQLQTFGIFAAGYLARPLGGIVMAHFGDLIGRKKMFSLSILMMAVPTLAIGMLPTYDAVGIAAPILLLLMRIMQGAAIGGEVPGAWVFVAEHVPHKRVGFACGILTAGLSLGILFGSLVATIITTIYSRQEVLDWAWRLPFFLGGIFGLCAMYLRRWLHETPVFKEMQERKALAEELPLKTVILNHKRAISISMLLTWLLSAGIVVVILMTPTYMQTVFNLEQSLTLKANSLAIISLAIGCVSVGYLCDKWGAGIVLIIGCILLATTTWFFYHNISHEPLKLFGAYSLTGLTVGVIGATLLSW
ncbi:alpha-ketoglutarate permease [Xenorhabdus eapokensis]|uniref:Alpha-ketoglutarate permease n=1 Tax=Xenorhabdus eapokensis TaxID=1873482 RepID=A0A1Q5TN96_9GAMM|nr:alpha-ketoglutarate permease [Xenorhabdus eapokensis]